MVEHCLREAGARGSNPRTPTNSSPAAFTRGFEPPAQAAGKAHALALATLGMTAIFVATVVGWWALLPEIAPKRIVVAVLPFDDGGAGANGASWLGDGIADDVRIALAQTPEFVVLQSAAAFAYRDRRHPLRALQDELGATHAVAGGARREGDSLKVAARLIYLAEATTLWEDDWEGGMAGLFAIRDAIAQAVAQKLLLLGDAQGTAGPPVPVAAYAAFLRARALARNGDLSGAERLVRESLQQADNPYAHAWLARRLAGQDAAAALGHAQAALQHTPDFRAALAPAEWLRFVADGDAARCFDALYELAETNRDSDAMRWLVELYAAGGHTADAALLTDQLRRLDPAGIAHPAEHFHAPPMPTSAELANVAWRPASDLFAGLP